MYWKLALVCYAVLVLYCVAVWYRNAQPRLISEEEMQEHNKAVLAYQRRKNSGLTFSEYCILILWACAIAFMVMHHTMQEFLHWYMTAKI